MSSKVGAIAEQKFKLHCLEREIPVLEPVLDNFGIDFVVKKGSRFVSIQVKSTLRKDPSRNSYKVTIVRGFNGRAYNKGDYDYLVVYIFELATWYIIPEKEIKATTIRLNPSSDKTKYSKYKEAWQLLK